MDQKKDTTKGAFIIGEYRYTLWRTWDESQPRVLFVLLNPSTADAYQDDNTLRKCIGFAQNWSYGSLEVVNLFAFRTKHPTHLRAVADPIGLLNDLYIRKAVARSTLIVCGWGIHGSLYYRDKAVLQLFAEREVYCLGTTKEGFPRHPLPAPYSSSLVGYNERQSRL